MCVEEAGRLLKTSNSTRSIMETVVTRVNVAEAVSLLTTVHPPAQHQPLIDLILDTGKGLGSDIFPEFRTQ
jgi:hypothetical protein